MRVLSRIHPARVVGAVSHDEHDAPPALIRQSGPPCLNGIPERGAGRPWRRRGESRQEHVGAAAQLRHQHHGLAERAETGAVVRQQPLHEFRDRRRRSLGDRKQTRARVEQDRDRDRLDVVLEDRDGLPRAVVLDLKVRDGEAADETAPAVQHGRMDRNDVRRALEYLPGAQADNKSRAYYEAEGDGNPRHVHSYDINDSQTPAAAPL